MGGDGTFADVVNSLVLRYQREAQVNVNDTGVNLAPMPIKVGIIPAGNRMANPWATPACTKCSGYANETSFTYSN